ncbi:hypothetical protein [Glutamicibacter sp. NPDC090743]|uniref:hypothetical protein n=1 Tax=Glutamicibacter sp. NPDC090743 TaxID=3364001 RepID=UPI00381F39F8
MCQHISIKKNPYQWPSWIVTYGDMPIGSAHSIRIAHRAAASAKHHIININTTNLCTAYLVKHVAEDMDRQGLHQYWTPAALMKAAA